MARLGHVLMGMAYRPHVTYDHDGGVKSQLEDMLRNGTQLLLASNHRNIHDQFNVAAFAQHEKSLRILRGNTNIPTKSELYSSSLLRYPIDTLGSLPVFRAQSIRKDYRDVAFTEEESEALDEAGRLLIETSIHKVNSGKHLFIFPEGTRGDSDTKLGKLRGGIGEIACGVSDDIDLVIVPIGLYYNGHNFRPHMHFAEPIQGPFGDPMAVVNHLGLAMQDALGGAITESQLRAA